MIKYENLYFTKSQLLSVCLSVAMEAEMEC